MKKGVGTKIFEIPYQPPKSNYTATTDPTVNNDGSEGYSNRSEWYNTLTGEIYRCVDATEGAAEWINTSLTLDDLSTVALTGDYSDLIGTPTLPSFTLSQGQIAYSDADGDIIGTDELKFTSNSTYNLALSSATNHASFIIDAEATDKNARLFLSADIAALSVLSIGSTDGTSDLGTSNAKSGLISHALGELKIKTAGEFDMLFGYNDTLQMKITENLVEVQNDLSVLGTSIMNGLTIQNPDLDTIENLYFRRNGGAGSAKTASIIWSNSNTSGSTTDVQAEIEVRNSGGSSSSRGGSLVIKVRQSGSDTMHEAFEIDDSGRVWLKMDVSMTGLSTSNPGGNDRLWKDNGTLKIT